MKALVISGGGSKGAFGGGVAEYLTTVLQKQYDLFVGASTGSLLVSLLAAQQIQKLKKVYTSVKQSDIFSNCPFIMQQQNGQIVTKINHFNVLKQFIRGKKTFGNTHQLRKTIAATFSPNDFEMAKKLAANVWITVTNLSMQTIEYKSIKTCSYEDFCDWMWISANMIPFMSLVQKNNMEYGDGGIGNNIPIEWAIKQGATEIDVIVLTPKSTALNYLPSANVLELTLDIFNFMLNQISQMNLHTALQMQRYAQHKELTINCYYTPYVLTENPLLFIPKQMTQWWTEGYEAAKQQHETAQ